MVGQTISHYRVLRKIGQGGMGVVYHAEDTVLRRPVALKFLAPAAAADGSQRARFYREAQAAGVITHPNICPVFGIEEHEDNVFIVMGFIEGESLNRVIGKGALATEQALDYALEIAAGLREAHEKGIVHRDIKSSNIIITPRGNAVITDFGLALLSDRSRITRTGTTLGTITYMSPEQALGKRVDQRTDIWSLGVVLYEMVTGHYPFTGDTLHTIVRSIMSEEPQLVKHARRRLPDEIGRIIGKMLAKNPDERYQHVADLMVDLRALRRTLPAADAQPSAPGSPAASARDEETVEISAGARSSAMSAATRRTAGPNRAWRWVAALAALSLLAGIAAVWWRLIG